MPAIDDYSSLFTEEVETPKPTSKTPPPFTKKKEVSWSPPAASEVDMCSFIEEAGSLDDPDERKRKHSSLASISLLVASVALENQSKAAASEEIVIATLTETVNADYVAVRRNSNLPLPPSKKFPPLPPKRKNTIQEDKSNEEVTVTMEPDSVEEVFKFRIGHYDTLKKKLPSPPSITKSQSEHKL
jgi:hypothetical protein